MKILIAADIEGVANVWRPEQTVPGSPDYERARRWLTAEASAAVRGAFTGGASEVRVADSHGHYTNILADELDPRARLIQGKPRRLGMLAGLENAPDGILMIGWHARAKSAGTLAHSINSFAFSRIWLDGREVGEIGLYCALAAEYDVPVLMLSGCECAVAEARQRCSAIAGVAVKWPLGAQAGNSLSCAEAAGLIEKAAAQACREATARKNAHPPRTPAVGRRAVRLQCQTAALADLFALWPGVRRETDECGSADTLAFDCASVEDAVRSLNALSAMSASLR